MKDSTTPPHQANTAAPRKTSALRRRLVKGRNAARVLLSHCFSRARLPIRSLFLALVAGVALRLLFVLVFPNFDGDSEVYGTIAKNILVHHAYALDGPFRSTLIRMPGYPVFMAVVFAILGIKNYFAVRYVQALVDMGSCLLIAGFVRDHAGPRAGLFALWIACLCPFTADYVAIPMAECPSIFAVALGLFAAGRLTRAVNSETGRRGTWLLMTAAALICAIGFRPDGVLLAGAILPGIWWYTRKRSPRAGMRAAVIVALLTMLPLVPWTIRNYRTFHVFQPLAPRSGLDPAEVSIGGYDRWTSTWEVDFVSLGEVYWRGDDLPIDIRFLPSRAFDSEQEYRRTARLISDYNDLCTITPELDARFAALAAQRIHHHLLRQYAELPQAAFGGYVASAAHGVSGGSAASLVGMAAAPGGVHDRNRLCVDECSVADRGGGWIRATDGSAPGGFAGLRGDALHVVDDDCQRRAALHIGGISDALRGRGDGVKPPGFDIKGSSESLIQLATRSGPASVRERRPGRR